MTVTQAKTPGNNENHWEKAYDAIVLLYNNGYIKVAKEFAQAYFSNFNCRDQHRDDFAEKVVSLLGLGQSR